MQLPDFLMEVPYGEILLAGHRIGLYHVLSCYKEGYSVEQLHEQYPTLEPELIRQVIAFYHANKPEVDAYLDREQAEIDRQRAAAPRRIDWAELQRRMEARRRGELP
jgi:uncharacterized protein (DUF433 family)